MNDLIERLRLGDVTSPDHELLLEAADALEALAKEKALQALHDENERLGLYKDAYAEQDCVGWFGYDTGLRLWFETNKGDDGAIPLYKARGNHD